jgi:peptidoglycan/LPS O-acetylase OafA/YrhL
MKILAFLVICFASASKCKSAISKEGQSIIQLILGDKSNNDLQHEAVSQIKFGGKELNDFGHFDACQRTKNSRYLVVDFNLRVIPTKVGLCVPEECTKDEIEELITSSHFPGKKNLQAGNGLKVEIYEPKDLELTVGGYVSWIGVGLLLVIVAYSTFQTYKMNHKTLPESSKKVSKSVLYLQCFSFSKNWATLFERSISDSSQIFDGIRAISTLWVIYGHIYLLRLMDVIKNLEDLPYHFEKPLATVGYSPTLSVDTFFWLSGFLIGYLVVQENEKSKGKINWGLSIFGRLLRILPVYIFAMVFVNFLITNWGSGPKSYHIKEKAQASCDKYWWTNFLFVNNYVPDYHGNNCVGQSWYVAADMQFYLLSIPLMIFYLKVSKKYFWLLITFLCTASVTYRLIIADHYNVNMCLLNSKVNNDDYNRIHTNGISRVTPYLLGILAGLVYNYKKYQKSTDPFVKFFHKTLSSRVKALSLYLIGLVLFNLIFWLPTKAWSDHKNDYMGYSREFNVFFMGFYSFAAGISYFLMFLPLLYDAFPVVSAVLAWTFWVPIAKASFCIYFLHMSLIRVFMANEQLPYIYSFHSIIIDFLSIGLVSVIAGMLVYTLIEAPFGNLLKLVLGRSPPPKKDKLLEVAIKEQEMQ